MDNVGAVKRFQGAQRLVDKVLKTRQLSAAPENGRLHT